jgi:hypothetical protein
LFHSWKDFAQRTNRSADSLYRDTRIDQSFCSLEGHQVLEAVPTMSPWRLCAGFDEACLRPILKLPPRDLQQIHDIACPKTPPDGIHSDSLESPKAPPVLNCHKRKVRFRLKSTQNIANLFRFRVKPFINRVVCLVLHPIRGVTGCGLGWVRWRNPGTINTTGVAIRTRIAPS